MGPRAIVPALVLGILGMTATSRAAIGDGSRAAAGSPAPEAQSSPDPEPPRLNLGAFGARSYAPPSHSSSGVLPHFESTIEVQAPAPRDVNDTMVLWWDHFHISTGSLYGHGVATRKTIDLVPLFEALTKGNKDKEQR